MHLRSSRSRRGAHAQRAWGPRGAHWVSLGTRCIESVVAPLAPERGATRADVDAPVIVRLHPHSLIGRAAVYHTQNYLHRDAGWCTSPPHPCAGALAPRRRGGYWGTAPHRSRERLAICACVQWEETPVKCRVQVCCAFALGPDSPCSPLRAGRAWPVTTACCMTPQSLGGNARTACCGRH